MALVGSWRVTGPVLSAGDSLLLGERLLLFQPCGLLSGSWRADRAGLFLGAAASGDPGCFAGGVGEAPRWLSDATGFREQGGDRLLVDSRGRLLARLSPGAHPALGPNVDPSFAAPPVVTDQLRAAFAEPAPAPQGLRPASLAAVLGRWKPVGDHSVRGQAYVSFAADGMWTGSDGCNGAGGRFAVGPGGEWLSTSGPSTLIGCANSPVTSWASTAGRVALDGAALVFLDAHGAVLGRCRRA